MTQSLKIHLLNKTRGRDFCPHCGQKVRWGRLITGMWVALDPQPVYYIPDEGKMWLIDRHRDGQIIKDCLIYKAGRGMDLNKLKKAYEPHYFKCSK